MILEPTIELWSASRLTDWATTNRFSEWIEDGEANDRYETHIDLQHEAAGRACYESWDRPNPSTATTESYLQHVLSVGHESVLAHGSLTLYISGVSRSLTHELVRHRFLAYSQLSQRYVPSDQLDWVCPPLDLEDVEAQREYKTIWDQAIAVYERRCKQGEQKLEAAGVKGTAKRKKAREAARAVLPNMTETRIVVTGNIRAWRDFVKLRWSEHADEEIDRLAGMIMEVLKDVAPYSVQDLERVQ